MDPILARVISDVAAWQVCGVQSADALINLADFLSKECPDEFKAATAKWSASDDCDCDGDAECEDCTDFEDRDHESDET